MEPSNHQTMGVKRRRLEPENGPIFGVSCLFSREYIIWGFAKESLASILRLSGEDCILGVEGMR